MINPDIENIVLISERELSQLEIENVTQIKTENKLLKISISMIIVVIVIILIANYADNQKNGETAFKKIK